MSSRKSVSAEGCSSSIRASACANWVRSRRIDSLASLCATDTKGGEARGGRCGATLRCAITVLRRFALLGAVALVFFFMGISARIPQKHGLGLEPRVDTGFATKLLVRAFSYGQPVSTSPENVLRRLAGIHQDRIVHSGPLATPCRTLGRSYTCGLCFWIPEKNLPYDRPRRHHHGKPVGLGNHAPRRRNARSPRRRQRNPARLRASHPGPAVRLSQWRPGAPFQHPFS